MIVAGNAVKRSKIRRRILGSRLESGKSYNFQVRWHMHEKHFKHLMRELPIILRATRQIFESDYKRQRLGYKLNGP